MRTPLLALALVAVPVLAQTPMDKTMVVVNGQSIDAKTYYKRMEVFPNVGQLVNGKFVQATPGYLALSKLINETLMLQLAKEKGVFPTDTEVDNRIKELTADNKDLLASLQKIGFSVDDLKYDTRLQLAEFKLQTMGINITDQEVEKFYNENKGSYTLPKRFKLRVIAVDNDAKKQAVDSALSGGKSFGDVARDLSIDLSKANDGQMGEIAEDSLATPTKAAIVSTKKGSTTQWLTNGDVSVKFLVEDVLEKQLVPLDADLKGDIRRNLMLDRGRVKNDLPKMMEDMRKKSKIELQGTIFDAQLKSAFGK
ncbi:MAG: peptidyl-prolyl cis-trans isomerase [Armatimonadetes bacterium]|nr:peptidyl-prolyl cis-trans isomerase [Armatimonadota bacterium]